MKRSNYMYCCDRIRVQHRYVAGLGSRFIHIVRIHFSNVNHSALVHCCGIMKSFGINPDVRVFDVVVINGLCSSRVHGQRRRFGSGRNAIGVDSACVIWRK